MLRCPDGTRKVAAACFPHPLGLPFLDTFGNSAPLTGRAHLVRGELTGAGPSKIGGCVATGLTETGAVGWIIQPLLRRPRPYSQARLRVVAPVAALSASMSNAPVVAVFIPAVQDWAKRHRIELNAGGHQLSDFVRVGVPLTLLVGPVTVAVVPQVGGVRDIPGLRKT